MGKIFFLLSFVLVVFSCTEKEMGPISESLGKPGKVEVLSTEAIPGGVIINYKIPKTNDILEIKAVYTLTNGQIRESSSSYYTSYITLDGYNDVEEHEVTLYTINRAREISDPITIAFRPGESSLSKTVKTMNIIADFGGVNYSWLNEDRANLIFEFYTEDDKGDMTIINIISSKTDSTNQIFRGYDAVPRKFAVNIRDNFGNSSGLIYPETGDFITPLFEIKFDKSVQNILYLNGDVSWDAWGARGIFMLDDDLTTFGHTENNTSPGASFTLDIGKTGKLSRLLVFQRSDGNFLYNTGNVKVFEVYTTNDLDDDPDGSWNKWTKQMTCTIVKPSGAPVGTIIEDDRIAAREGHDFSFPITMESVRYVRIKVLSTWGNTNYTYFSEITVFGKNEQ